MAQIRNLGSTPRKERGAWKNGRECEFSIWLGVPGLKDMVLLPNGALGLDTDNTPDEGDRNYGVKTDIVRRLTSLPEVQALEVGEKVKIGATNVIGGVAGIEEFRLVIYIRRNCFKGQPDPKDVDYSKMKFI